MVLAEGLIPPLSALPLPPSSSFSSVTSLNVSLIPKFVV
jgi:hypothetical protein